MGATPSTMLELGTPLPAFHLPDYNGKLMSDRDFANAPGLLVAFISTHCPFVKLIEKALGAFGSEYQPKGLAMIAIGANDLGGFPQDGPEGMKAQAALAGFTFPYLFDETQKVAQAFKAACTPDLFLFDGSGKLAYRGQFDAARPGNNVSPTGSDIRAAADAVLAGKPVPPAQTPSIGCNIKWRAGNEPSYYRG